jgi:ribonucleoside-triphosphate reductase
MNKARGMNTEDVQKIIEAAQSGNIEFIGYCYDCKKETSLIIEITDYDTWEYKISGGAIYITEEPYIRDEIGQPPLLNIGLQFKCEECFEKDPILHDIECEVYSRCVGYLRPVSQWNEGKKEEFKDRKGYIVEEKEEG